MSKKAKIFLVVALLIIIVLLVLRLCLWNQEPKAPPEDVSNPTSSGEVKTSSDDSKIISLTTENYPEYVQKSDKTVVIEFMVSWAEECKEQSQIINQLSQERDDVIFARIDANEEEELTQYFGINVFPTVVVMQDGSIKGKKSGVVPAQKIIDLIEY